MRRATTTLIGSLGALVFAAATATGGEAPAVEADAGRAVRFFETRIRPVLAERCFGCHGPTKQWAGLRLDSREAVVRGGESGAAVVPGRPDESLLLRAVRHADDASAMPPEGKGEALSEQQAADFARWIAEGAVFPASAVEPAEGRADRGRNHWAFRPPVDPPVPAVRDETWPRNPIDRFVLARLEAEGLRPAFEADRRPLLRRLTFDLTGLPPTPAEMSAFIADLSPDAYERAVDRLLASPSYGERWGRHWLDIARYADSNGLDENVAYGNAWRYRDYVVAAFNADRPYDEFLVEQVAGDLLPAADEACRRRQLTATGFLALGPKVLAERDAAKMEMDVIDEQLDTLGRATLGLTIGCARCHDHKFDPITAADYYALAGVFKSTRTMEKYTNPARWHENVLPCDETRSLTAVYEAKVSAAKAAIAAADEVAEVETAERGAPAGEHAARDPKAAKAELARLRAELVALEKTPPEPPSAPGVAEGTVADAAINLRGSHLSLGEVVSRRVPDVFTTPSPPDFPPEQSGRLELARWLTDPAHPLTARVFVNRAWRWHFGLGLVRTPDNFGLLGSPPTHPELLDWLAVRFAAGGWSVKSLHRMILLSSTYRQSAQAPSETLERDPENHLFGRAVLLRLEAEPVRDALLAVGGRLDRSMGGSLLAVKNRAYFFDHTSKDTTSYESTRRSLYLPVVRNNVYSLFQLLDFPDPAVSSGNRATTTVAPQALLMMNGKLVGNAAAALADGLLREDGLGTEIAADDAGRLRRLYATVYGREPAEEELAADLAFLDEAETALAAEGAARRRAWACLCQVMLASNEFVFLR